MELEVLNKSFWQFRVVLWSFMWFLGLELGASGWYMTRVWSAMKEVPKTSEKKSAYYLYVWSTIPNVRSGNFEKVVIWNTLLPNRLSTQMIIPISPVLFKSRSWSRLCWFSFVAVGSSLNVALRWRVFTLRSGTKLKKIRNVTGRHFTHQSPYNKEPVDEYKQHHNCITCGVCGHGVSILFSMYASVSLLCGVEAESREFTNQLELY
jgi:hypothetical protein